MLSITISNIYLSRTAKNVTTHNIRYRINGHALFWTDLLLLLLGTGSSGVFFGVFGGSVVVLSGVFTGGYGFTGGFDCVFWIIFPVLFSISRLMQRG